MAYRFFILQALGFVFISSPLYAQISKYDTNYVKENYNKLCVTLLVDQSDYDLTVSSRLNDNLNLMYNASDPAAFGIGIDYKWLTFSYTTSAGQNQNFSLSDMIVQGFSFGITSNKYWARAFYRTQQGLDFSLDDERLTAKRDDINNHILHTNFNYIFNHKKYSHNATLWQIDQQLKSAGTFTLGLASAVYKTVADSSLIPSEKQPEFGASAAIKESLTVNHSITFGYLHTFVVKKRAFAHISFIPGFGLRTTQGELNNGDKLNRKYEIGSYYELRFALGYNSKNFYTGINVVTYGFSEGRYDALIEHNYSTFRLFLGVRIPLRLKIPLEKLFKE
ncbi:MAG: DUF4421 domain-containing protein [Bacteroidia bacterium]|jgi:hypothetical protein|nr:DUF4421 domain-containing protein [Bacteroidia bacterium]